jgi:hypothetical protein
MMISRGVYYLTTHDDQHHMHRVENFKAGSTHRVVQGLMGLPRQEGIIFTGMIVPELFMGIGTDTTVVAINYSEGTEMPVVVQSEVAGRWGRARTYMQFWRQRILGQAEVPEILRKAPNLDELIDAERHGATIYVANYGNDLRRSYAGREIPSTFMYPASVPIPAPDVLATLKREEVTKTE